MHAFKSMLPVLKHLICPNKLSGAQPNSMALKENQDNVGPIRNADRYSNYAKLREFSFWRCAEQTRM